MSSISSSSIQEASSISPSGDSPCLRSPAFPLFLLARDIRKNRSIRGYGVPKYSDNIAEAGDEPETPAEELIAIGMPTLRHGACDMYVAAMQFCLVSRGYGVGRCGIDGDFGIDTLSALKRYQTSAGLTADGVCGQATWEKLKVE